MNAPTTTPFAMASGLPPTGGARDEALACAFAGMRVFPFHGSTDGSWDCGHEHPLDIKGHPSFGFSNVSASTDPTLIGSWFDQRPNGNYGVAAGYEIGTSGTKLMLIEANDQKAMRAAMTWLENSQMTYTVLAEVVGGDGTVYLYFGVPLHVSMEKFKWPGTAFKSVPYAPGPGSVDHSGAKTTWVKNLPSTQAQAADLEASVNLNQDEKCEMKEVATLANCAIQTLAEKVKTTANHTDASTAALARVASTRAFAIDYDELGFKLCRIAKGGKAPKDPSWQHNPIDANKAGGHGLGLIHALSGTCAIDVDDLKNAEGWFACKGIDLGDLLHADDAVQIKSGRSNRAKLLFRLPSQIELLDTFKVKNPDGSMMVEFRCASDGGTGCQDVLPPTVHPDTGKPYEWAGAGDYQNLPILPESLVTLWQNLSIAPTPVHAVVAAPGGKIVEGGRNDALFRLGGDMARLRLSVDAISAVLSLENTDRCLPPLAEAEVRRIAISASTGSIGAKAAASSELSASEQSELLKQATKVVAANMTGANIWLNSPDPRLPAVMNAVVEYCNANARTVQPAFAVCTALAACSSVLARDFCGAAGAYTNMYCIAIGPTACGKENTLQTLAKIVAAYDAKRIAGVPASDSGVLTAVKRNPASVFIIDEIGEVLKSIFDPKAASHKAMIGTTFMELYTKGGQAYRGKEYALQTGAGGRAREDIFSPNPSIFGATTATTFYEGMNSAAINSGFLPRIMVFRAPDLIPLPNTAYAPSAIPEIITAWLDAVRTRVAGHIRAVAQQGNLTGATTDQHIPIDVPYSKAAAVLFVAEQVKIVHRRNNGMDPLESNMLSRLIENAGRVALTLALAEDPWTEEVSAECFVQAMDIVNHCSVAFMADIRANLFDSSHAELESKVMQKITQYYVDNGKPISDGILVDRCKPYGSVRPQERKNAIDALVRQGKVTVQAGRNAGSLRYFPSYEVQ